MQPRDANVALWPVHYGANAWVERRAAQVFEPCDASAFKAAFQGAREDTSGLLNRQGGASIGTGERAEREGEVCHGTRQAARSAKGGPGESGFGIGDASHGRAKADHVAESSRVAQRAARIGTAGDGGEAAGKRDRRAAGRATAGLGEVVGIVRGAENLIESLRARAEFRGIGFADGDRAGPLDAFHHKIICSGNVIFVKQRPKGGADSACLFQVFISDR